MKAAPLLLTTLLLGEAAAADWPVWRGPNRDGISTETGWSLPADPKILWEAEVGLGFASFVVAGGRVLTTGHAEGADTVFCLDEKTGSVLWNIAAN